MRKDGFCENLPRGVLATTTGCPGGTKARLQADFFAMRHQPFGAGDQIAAVGRLGGDAGKANVIAELCEKTRFVLFKIIEGGLHKCFRTLGDARAVVEAKIRGNAAKIYRNNRCNV